MSLTKNKLADSILLRWWSGEVPVDVRVLAKRMNIEIHFHDDNDKSLIHAKMMKECAGVVSILNKPTEIQNRFAVALGIAQIYHNIEYSIENCDELDGTFIWWEYSRNHTSSNTTNALDSLHNDIAIELLVPLESLKYVIGRYHSDTELLSKRFDVSEVLMYNAINKIV